MSDVARTNGPEPQAETREALTLPDDILSRIVTETERAFAARAARPSPIHLKSWEEIERFATKAARSGMVPKDYVGKPDAIAIAVQMGSEIGLAPMQAVQNIAVINGRPALWGDAMLGLCRASAVCREVRESFTGEGDTLTAVCVAVRRDQAAPIIQSFSVAQAKKAGLWGKNVWAQYPERMLQMRARSFALRDAFPDVLRGLLTAEEARDIPWEDTGLPPVGAPPVATAEPIKPPPTRTASVMVDAIEAQAKAATTAADLDQLEQGADVGAIRTHVPPGRPQRDRLELILREERGRIAAFWEAQGPDDVEDHLPEELRPPADANETRADKVITAIAVAPSAEVIDRAILGNASNTAWISELSRTGRMDIIQRLEAARQARINALEGAAP